MKINELETLCHDHSLHREGRSFFGMRTCTILLLMGFLRCKWRSSCWDGLWTLTSWLNVCLKHWTYEFKCFYSISWDDETIAAVAFWDLEIREPFLCLFFFNANNLKDTGKKRSPQWSSLPHMVCIAFKSCLTTKLCLTVAKNVFYAIPLVKPNI